MSARFDYDTILELSRAGWSLAEVAARVGCTERTVSRVRKLAGVSKRSNWQPLTSERLAEVERLLADGCSLREVRRTLRIGNWTLQKHFHGQGWSRVESAQFAAAVRRSGVTL